MGNRPERLGQPSRSTPAWRRPSARERLRHLVAGLRYRYPACCAVRYALAVGSGQAAVRGVRYTQDGRAFVPCLVLHREHRSYRAHSSAASLRRAA